MWRAGIPLMPGGNLPDRTGCTTVVLRALFRRPLSLSTQLGVGRPGPPKKRMRPEDPIECPTLSDLEFSRGHFWHKNHVMAAEELKSLALMEVESVHRLAHAMTLDSGRAEELVVEAFRLAFEHSPLGVRERDVRGWLFRTVVQAHHSQLAAAGSTEATKKCPGAPGPTLPAIEVRPKDETAEWFLQALPAMSFRCRAVVVLWAVEGLSHREIAEVMSEPVGTVSLWLQRAQSHLAKRWNDRASSSASDGR